MKHDKIDFRVVVENCKKKSEDKFQKIVLFKIK